MKQIYIVILAIYFLTYVTGITFYQHYCMGELVSSSIFPATEKNCAKCGMEHHSEKKEGCCKDVAKKIKSNDSHLSSSLIFVIDGNLHYQSNFFVTGVEIAACKILLNKTQLAHAPPLQKQPLFLRYENFRI